MLCAQRRVGGVGPAPRRAFTSAPGLRTRPKRTARAAVLGLEDPYRTLGVPANADEKEIKAAYRRLALKYHPDVCQSHDAERRFVSIQHAYEVLTGRRQAPRGVHTTNQVNNWDFQDWFWSFSASRRWSAQHHARPPPDAPRGPQARTVLNSQLAGLRQRAAIRHTKAARDASPAPAAAHGQQQEPHHHQEPQAQQQQEEQEYQQEGTARHQAAQQQQHHYRPPPTPAVDYDTTAMSDGVNMAAGVGYDPWSPEAAAAARRPRFTATESAKSQVVGQLGGLKRRAAVKQRADAEQERPRGAPAAAAAAEGEAAWPQAHACVEDDPWSV